MTKNRDARVTISLECTSCTQEKSSEKSTGISRYTTRKNRRNTPIRLELKKYCSHCHKHTLHKELKK
uniref:Large ribosomal subunit protein bL33c n=1 Tax=Odontosoria chinensis TaxID=32133 RepID=A0A343WSF3_9MONI|nr:ribosomal protein L33 [Odontosoria chinensis]